ITVADGYLLIFTSNVHNSDTGAFFGRWRLSFPAAPAPPVLRVARSGNNIVLSWPVSSPGFVLEFQDALSPSNVWNLVPGSPSVVGGQYTVNLSLNPGGQFFRLRQ